MVDPIQPSVEPPQPSVEPPAVPTKDLFEEPMVVNYELLKSVEKNPADTPRRKTKKKKGSKKKKTKKQVSKNLIEFTPSPKSPTSKPKRKRSKKYKLISDNNKTKKKTYIRS